MTNRLFYDSILYHLLLRVYSYIKLSILFFAYLVRGILTMRTANAIYALTAATRRYSPSEGRKVYPIFRQAYQEGPHSRVLSVVIPLVYIYFLAFLLLPFPSYVPQLIVLTARYVSIMALSVWQLTLTTAFTLGLDPASARGFLWGGVYLMGKHPIRILFVAAIFLACGFLAAKNTVFLVFFFPGLFAGLTYLSLKRVNVSLLPTVP